MAAASGNRWTGLLLLVLLGGMALLLVHGIVSTASEKTAAAKAPGEISREDFSQAGRSAWASDGIQTAASTATRTGTAEPGTAMPGTAAPGTAAPGRAGRSLM